LKLLIGAKTDLGMVRQNNEDNLLVTESEGLLLVADGMGGHASGEVASKIAVDVIKEYFDGTKAGRQLQVGEYEDEFSEATNRIGSAIRLANQAIYEAAQGSPALHGMGTTVAAVLMSGESLSVAHVGDSRVYLIRAGSMQQLTDDHSLVAEQVKRDLISKEEAKESEMKNILTRALGVVAEVEVDLDEMTLSPGDILVLCSDGLSNMVPDEDILSVVTTTKDPVVACENLVNMANANGGKDNVTVIVARTEDKEAWFQRLFNFIEWFRR
jgi:serine/threonine protein phosphatase PrpC